MRDLFAGIGVFVVFVVVTAINLMLYALPVMAGMWLIGAIFG